MFGLILIACSTRGAPPDPPAPAALVVGATLAPDRPGEPLVELSGGGLTAPFTVPLWLEPDPEDDKAAIYNDVLAFGLSDGRIYVEQHNDRAVGPWKACRVLDPATRAFGEPVGCVEGAFWRTNRAEALGDDLVGIWSSSEGVGAFTLASWTPTAGQTTHLVVETGQAGAVEARRIGDAVLLSTPCDPRGASDACGLGPAEGPARTWSWTRADGLTGPLP